jgi:DNA-binding GntR family transcriptional regulator
VPIPAGKLTVATLRHRIVQEIRQAIVNGDLLPGERLIERDLAARLGTSLTVAREAIIQLEAEGLITKRANSSTHLVKLSPSELSEIFSVRCVLEEYAVGEAAQHGTTQEVRQLERLHQEAVRSAKAGNRHLYIQKDLAWHQLIWEMSRNEYLCESLRRVALPFFGFSLITPDIQVKFDMLDDALTHEPIMNAISSHDPAKARSAYRAALDLWTPPLATWKTEDTSESASVKKRSQKKSRLTAK